MKILTMAVLMLMISDNNKLRFNFGNENGKNTDWVSLSDNVMGGVSSSNVKYSENSIKFSGSISFQNNGGFASVRSAFGNYNLSNYTDVSIRFKSENQKFALTLENSRTWWEPNYKYEFQSEAQSDWKTISFKLIDFHEEIIGRKTGKLIQKSMLKDICRIGVITNEKKEGPFAIEIDYIEFSKK